MVFLNCSVFNKAEILQGNTIRVRVEIHHSAEGQWQERTKRMTDRKVTFDVSLRLLFYVMFLVVSLDFVALALSSELVK